MLRWWLVVLFLAEIILSQPVTDVARFPQLEGECCPCPKPGLQTLETAGDVARASLQDSTAEGTRKSMSADLPLDDSLCRFCDPDSQGAPSVLSRAMRPLRPTLTHGDSKEEPKPLLHPEVEFATSFLDTLREVTDEEYEDAVARDAAKSAAKVPDTRLADGEVGNEKKIVTIIVNDDEDAMVPEASHVEAARCAPPLGTEHDLTRMFERKPILSRVAPKTLKNNFDMDSGASNMNEQKYPRMNNLIDKVKLKASPSLLRFFPSRSNEKSVGNPNLKDTLKLRTLKNHLRAADDVHKKIVESLNLKKLPALNINGKINKSVGKQINPINDVIRSNPAAKLKFAGVDSNVAPSNLHEEIIKPKDNFHYVGIKPLSTPFKLNHFLKLKDVELIIPKQNNVKITIPSLNLHPMKARPIKIKEKNTENSVLKSNSIDKPGCKVNNLGSKVTEEEVKKLDTQILDVVPSPSQNQYVIEDSSRTKILDSLPEQQQVSIGDNELKNQNAVSKIDNGNKKIFKHKTNSVINMNSSDKSKQREEFIRPQNDNEKTILIENGKSDTVILIDDETINPFNSEDYANADELNNLTLSPDQSDYVDSDEPVFIVPQDAFDSNDFESLPDSNSDPSNTIIQIATQDDNTDDIELSLIGENSRSDESNQPEKVHSEKSSSTMSQALQNIKERMSEKLNEIKSSLSNPKESRAEELRESIDDKAKKKNLERENTVSTLPTPLFNNDTSSECVDEDSELHMKELEKLSNKLLDLSNNKDTLARSEVSDPKSDEDDKSESVEVDKFDNKNKDDEDESETPDTEQNVPVSAVAGILEALTNIQNDINSNGSEEEDTTTTENERNAAEDETCPNFDFDENLGEKDASTQEKETEMSVQASEPKPNLISRDTQESPIQASPLDGLIVQPPSLIPGSDLFNRPLPSINNLFNGNTELPTVDDIRSRIDNALGLNTRTNNENNSDDDFESAEDCSDMNPTMSTSASTNAKSALFPLKPLEDLNLDIFQIRPLSQSKIPGLDLNSFKTRLAIPENLGLKPVKLQSSMGKKGSLLGATLTFGPEKISSKSNMKFGKGSPVLSSTLPNIPDLNEIRQRVHANTANLLSASSLTSFHNNPLRNAPTFEEIHDNLRSHTENTVKNIQQTLASTLKESQVRQDKYAKPQNLLEDMNEKMQALHLDFNDRLSTIHDKILDQTKLSSINTPFLKKARNFNSMPRSKSISSFSSPLTYSKDFRASQPISQNRFQNKDNTKTFKISKAVSGITPKTVKVPKLISTSTVSPFSKPLQRDSRLQLKDKSPNVPEKLYKGRPATPSHSKSSTSKNSARSKAENSRKLFSDSRGFASETSSMRVPLPIQPKRKPLFLPRTTQIPSERIKSNVLNEFKSASSSRVPGALKVKDRKLTDGSVTTEENKLSRDIISKNKISNRLTISSIPGPQKRPNSKAPSKSFISREDIQVPSAKKVGQSTQSNIPPNPSTSKNSRRPLSSNSKSSSTQPKSANDISFPVIPWARPIDNAFLDRVREGIRSRLATFTIPDSPSKLVLNSEDMSKAASESRDVIVRDGKTLKENVAYKCKMVCVRDPEE